MTTLTASDSTLLKSYLPSGPRGHFLLGNTREFQRDTLGFITHMAEQYGDVARYRLGNVTFHQVNHPDGVQHILQENNHNYIKGSLFDILRAFAGNGLFTSEGSYWLRQRRLMQPAFHRQRIAGFGEIMTRQTLAMLERWQTTGQPGPGMNQSGAAQIFDISQEMTDLTMAIITETMFGTHIEDQTHAISQAITRLLADINFRFTLPFYPSLRVPTPRNRRARRDLATIDQVVFRIIEERRHDSKGYRDLLAMLMDAVDEETGERMDDSQLRNEVLTIFIAGHETTAVALTWTFFLLSQHPDVERRLHTELESVLVGRPPTFADLHALTYTRMIIDEALRLYPPAWITNRETVADDVICGYRIPAGAVVAVSPYVTHRLEAYWPQPDRFDPERFNPDLHVDLPRFAYFPFGGGPHQCIGNTFALVEATLVLATIAQRYRLELPPGHVVMPSPQTTLRPRGGLPMLVRKIADQ